MSDAKHDLTKELGSAMIAYLHSMPTDTIEGLSHALADICHANMVALLGIMHTTFDAIDDSEEVIKEFAERFVDDMIELDKRTRE